MLTVVFALLAAAGNAVSSVLQRIANRREANSGDRGAIALVHLLRQPVWLLGLCAIIAGFCLQAAALSVGEVAEVQPLMAMELPITLLIASRVSRQPLKAWEWAAVVSMVGGIVLFLFALQPTQTGEVDHAGSLRWILEAGATGGVIVALGLVGHALGKALGAALFGVGAGICFALTAVFMSAAVSGHVSWSVLTHWQIYLMAITGITAVMLLQLGLQAGTLVVVQPGVTLADPIVAVILGATLFGEHLRTGGWLLLALAGVLALGWGTFTLSRCEIASYHSAAGTGSPRGSDSQHDASHRRDRPDSAPER